MYFKKRGQISFEYMAIFGAASLMIIPLLIIFASQSSSIEADVAYAQAESALSRMVVSSEEIYFQGSPARKTDRIQFPKSLSNVVIEDNTITFTLNTVDGEFNIFKESSANMSGTINHHEGVHVLVFEAVGDVVVISEAS